MERRRCCLCLFQVRGRLSEEPEAGGALTARLTLRLNVGRPRRRAAGLRPGVAAEAEHANRSAAGLREGCVSRRFLLSRAMRSNWGQSCASWWQKVFPP